MASPSEPNRSSASSSNSVKPSTSPESRLPHIATINEATVVEEEEQNPEPCTACQRRHELCTRRHLSRNGGTVLACGPCNRRRVKCSLGTLQRSLGSASATGRRSEKAAQKGPQTDNSEAPVSSISLSNSVPKNKDESDARLAGNGLATQQSLSAAPNADTEVTVPAAGSKRPRASAVDSSEQRLVRRRPDNTDHHDQPQPSTTAISTQGRTSTNSSKRKTMIDLAKHINSSTSEFNDNVVLQDALRNCLELLLEALLPENDTESGQVH